MQAAYAHGQRVMWHLKMQNFKEASCQGPAHIRKNKNWVSSKDILSGGSQPLHKSSKPPIAQPLHTPSGFLVQG